MRRALLMTQVFDAIDDFCQNRAARDVTRVPLSRHHRGSNAHASAYLRLVRLRHHHGVS